MKDFLSGCKNTFHMESDLASNNEISGIVEDNLIEYNYDGVYGPIPDPETGMVDLSSYASSYIPFYSSIKEIPQENLDYLQSGLVANNMQNMFFNCNDLLSIPKLDINTSNVTDMHGMFCNMYSVETINISGFDTSSAMNTNQMFFYCNVLTTIEGVLDLSNNNISLTFLNCNNLAGVKIKNPPQYYYDNKEQFESDIGLSSDQYEIVS